MMIPIRTAIKSSGYLDADNKISIITVLIAV
jgi:hypothetical protein